MPIDHARAWKNALKRCAKPRNDRAGYFVETTKARSIDRMLFGDPAPRTQNFFLIENIALGKHVPT
jgi:hypothetical protein